MANPDLPVGALDKPMSGERQRNRHTRRLETRQHEQTEMRAAKARDHGKCRWPGCDSATVGLRIDAAHMRDSHRGAGGNPDGSRTERDKVITFCCEHHDAYDVRRTIDVQPLTAFNFSGPCAFYLTPLGRPAVHVASEKILGVSTTRVAR